MAKLYEVDVNAEINTKVLIKQADVRTAKNGNPYIAFTFQDRSGAMEGKYWSATEEEINRFQSGRVVHLIGKREVYNQKAQVRIEQLWVLKEGDPDGNPALYMDEPPMSYQEMTEEVQSFLFKITDSTINRIVRHILKEYGQAFFTYPAAKRHHHAFTGGLGFHTLSILRLAEHMVKQYPSLDPSLLYGGALLHDMGKTVELSGPIGTEYTIEGNLMGHIVLMEDAITKACQDLSIDQHNERVVLLKHMILSHHGLLEYGSPVRPQLFEAEVLHCLDNLDATCNMIQTALDKTAPASYSDRIFGLDNRAFYKPAER
ncbi:HD domain-containing protein [Atopobacter sp. AH10]|uniref:3'-5' exoribonuclease YhaM family protein n=1 Tax=Atopobacter sp. AH10 TaxID=2315861 RepID=UPI000EF27778|nr:HD domain-containing protein [Atopobacter sp. AH10]RLK63675.1 HD domain-containing protein [Atopobacter sp. AH10]